MSEKVEKFLDITAEHHADLDHDVFLKEKKYKDILTALLNSASQRDAKLWALFPEVNAAITLDDISMVPMYQRGPEWSEIFATIFSICRLEAFCKVFGVDFIAAAEKDGIAMQKKANEMSIQELHEASKKRDLNKRVAAARITKYPEG